MYPMNQLFASVKKDNDKEKNNGNKPTMQNPAAMVKKYCQSVFLVNACKCK